MHSLEPLFEEFLADFKPIEVPYCYCTGKDHDGNYSSVETELLWQFFHHFHTRIVKGG